MFQFECNLLYLLQLWGRNDFNGLYFEQFHIVKAATGITGEEQDSLTSKT